MTDDELIQFLVTVAAAYYNRRYLAFTPLTMDATIQELDSPRLLSLRAIAAIVGCDEGHVLRIVGSDASRPRGKLNPAHASWLGYLLAYKKQPHTGLIAELIRNGTSLSTIASLTNVSQATLYRWRKQ